MDQERAKTNLRHYNAESQEFKEDEGELYEFLIDVLQCPNLLILSGAGTSYDVPGFQSMDDLMGEARTLPVTAEGQWSYAQVVHRVYGMDRIGGPGQDGEYVPLANEPTDVEVFISQCSMFADLHGAPEVRDYCLRLERRIAKVCQFPAAEEQVSDHVEFVRKIARRPANMPRAQLFTTNYDFVFERAAQRAWLVALDGFSFSPRPTYSPANLNLDVVRRDTASGQLEPVTGVFYLLKVHGSADWNRVELATREVEIVRDSQPVNPVLIYPSTGKYAASYEEPFIEFVTRFQTSLREDNTALIIAGYGFRDRHLNNPVRQALRTNPALKVVVVEPFFDFDTEAATPQAIDRSDNHRHFKERVDSGDRRVALVSAKFGVFANQLPGYLSETEREKFERENRTRV